MAREKKNVNVKERERQNDRAHCAICIRVCCKQKPKKHKKVLKYEKGQRELEKKGRETFGHR